MEQLTTEAGRVFLTQGVVGALCLLLIAAVVFLYRERRESEKICSDRTEKMIEARESIAKALNANTLALEANNKASDARTRATEEIAREVSDMRQLLELAIQKNKSEIGTLGDRVEDIRRALQQRGIT